MPSITLYGLSNCDTVKKARAWLAGQGVEYTFVDFKKSGVPEDRLPVWAEAAGWDKLINRQGTTWRQLDAADQLTASGPEGAQKLALAMPSIIKRPVVEWADGCVTVGFNSLQFAETLHGIRG